MVEGVSQGEIKCRKGNQLREVVTFLKVVVFTEKATFEQRLGRAEGASPLEELCIHSVTKYLLIGHCVSSRLLASVGVFT